MISRYQSVSSQRILKRRLEKRVEKTGLDYLVTAISPLLVMLLVGSLVFFVIQIFYRGEMVGGIRWVMFWFVIAIVLVARIGIEQSPFHAAAYGAALAGATWLFLMRTHPAFLLGIALLALVWWSSHKLVHDCTLIDDDDDSTSRGLTESIPEEEQNSPKNRSEKPNRRATKKTLPGRWVIYYSLAALPIFGLGQMVQGDEGSSAFTLLLIYLTASAGLLLSTSFLGLRRYLRQRSIKMPNGIAGKWLTSGAKLAAVIFLIALLFPRPGVGSAWNGLNRTVEHTIRRANNLAMRFNASGSGEGREGARNPNQETPLGDADAPSQRAQVEASSEPARGTQPASNRSGGRQEGKQTPTNSGGSSGSEAPSMMWLGRALVLLAALIAIIRYWKQIGALIAALYGALIKLLHGSFSIRAKQSPSPSNRAPSPSTTKAFRTFTNPFASNNGKNWTQEALITHTFNALEAWGETKGIKQDVSQTPSERIKHLSELDSHLAGHADSLARDYSRLAYSRRLPASPDLQALKALWQVMSRT